MDTIPGPILLFGSGETSPSGRKVFDFALQKLPYAPRIALLETPSGFELNSARVIGRVAEFMQVSLQNFHPQITTIPARARNTAFSPDDFAIVSPLLEADLIFMGPGSPTYAERQLCDSLAWHMLIARHRLGATLAFASAATIAISASTLPVYEIYKAGEDLHWKDGLNFFGLYGLDLVFIPHWNNTEGGAELDTSRCFMGQARFSRLMEMLPSDNTVIGLDEKTALLVEPHTELCHVIGKGSVTVLHTGHLHDRRSSTSDLAGTGLPEIAKQRESHVHQYHNKASFPLSEIGYFRAYRPEANLPPSVWQQALEVHQRLQAPHTHEPPSEVLTLVKLRQAARKHKDWAAADQLRSQITALGWQTKDTPEGPEVTPV